ncbi:MAG: hypothetical protein AAGC63_00975, partial [Propionicimonas sp.]|nr:hypothetical protein [Propionicimonas sp.]
MARLAAASRHASATPTSGIIACRDRPHVRLGAGSLLSDLEGEPMEWERLIAAFAAGLGPVLPQM